jgi:toxin ParE1/3/4
MEIVLAAEAQVDMEDIYAYSAKKWGGHQADQYQELLFASLYPLLDNPEIGRPRPEIGKGIRSLLVEHHVAYYIVSGTTIVVVRVMHQRQQPGRYMIGS